MSEDGAGDGNSSQGPTFDTTGMEGGEAGTAMAFGTANIEHLLIQTNQFGSDDSGRSKQEPKQQEKGDFGDAVLVSISGRTLKTIQRLDSIPVQDGEVSVRGTYSNQNVETTATCEKGIIVHLEAKCGLKTNADARCRSIWKLAGIAREATFTLIANSYSGLRHITSAVKDTFGVLWVRMQEGSLILEFGHDNTENAEQMVSKKDEVALMFKTLLGKYNIKDEFSVNCEIKIMDEGKGKQFAASQSESGIYSKSSRGEPSRRVKQVVADLQRDKDEDDCDECRKMRDERDPDVNTNQVVIHIDYATLMRFNLRESGKMRKKKVFELTKKFSAVRNSGGGCILCHISGRYSQDRYLNHFDEIFLQSSKLLLGEEEIYSHTIQRKWYGNTDFVIITVPHAACVCTASVNSYIAEYGGCRDVSLPQLRALLFGKQAAGHGPPLIRGVEDLLQEGVDKKFKSQCFVHVRASEQFYAYGIQRYISAFSQNRSGGSLYIGVREEDIMHSGYRSRVLKVEGCPIPSREHTAYTEELKALVRENMMIIPNIHTKQQCELQDLVDVAFHHVREDNYVIEISVGTVNGCVFTDKGGPSAYKLDEKGSLCRMSWQEWMEKLRAEQRPT